MANLLGLTRPERCTKNYPQGCKHKGVKYNTPNGTHRVMGNLKHQSEKNIKTDFTE